VEDGHTAEDVQAELTKTLEALAKATKQAEEKQKLLDEHRTQFADQKKAIEDMTKTIEKLSKQPVVESKPVIEDKSAEDIKAENEAKINAMPEEEQTKLQAEYNDMTVEQRKYLDTPEGMSTFLKNRVPTVMASTNPFAPKKKPADPRAQFEALFGSVSSQSSPPVGANKSVGIQLDAVTSKPNSDFENKLNKDRQFFNQY
jgi:chromosome segregation ATPase